MGKSKSKAEEVIDKTWVDAVTLHQEFVKEAWRQLEHLKATAPKDDTPNGAWFKAFAALGRLVAQLVKEGRMLERDRDVEDSRSLEEIVEEMTPVLVNLGWRPPRS